MSEYKPRIVITICLLFFFLCGYWIGLEYYLKIAASITLPAQIYYIWNTKNYTEVIYYTLNISSNNSVVTETVNVNTPFNKSEEIYFRTIATDTFPSKITTFGKRTIYKYNLINKSAISTVGQNGTFYLTIISWFGRLGNNIFQYASLLGIARAQGREMFVAPDSDLQKTFKLQHVGEHNGSDEWQVFHSEWGTFDATLMNLPLKDMRISGYLQSYKYFKDVSDELREEFIFQDSVASAAAMILDDVHSKNKGSIVIGVHVRRGDFLRMKRRGYGVPAKSYFIKAFDWMKSKFSGRNITFIVVSEDSKWCKANLIGDGVIAAPAATPGVHLAILASCDHVIMSGGTFGYWGGWLAAGYVIYYTGYMSINSTLGKQFSPKDFYPPLWKGLGN